MECTWKKQIKDQISNKLNSALFINSDDGFQILIINYKLTHYPPVVTVGLVQSAYQHEER